MLHIAVQMSWPKSDALQQQQHWSYLQWIHIRPTPCLARLSNWLVRWPTVMMPGPNSTLWLSHKRNVTKCNKVMMYRPTETFNVRLILCWVCCHLVNANLSKLRLIMTSSVVTLVLHSVKSLLQQDLREVTCSAHCTASLRHCGGPAACLPDCRVLP